MGRSSFLDVVGVWCFVLLLCGHSGWACNPGSTGGSSRKPQKPDTGILHEPMADVWLGAMEFIDFFCGVPERSPQPTGNPTAQPLLESAPSEINMAFLAQNMKMPTGKVNPYKFDHSFVYFRGQTFEWGASMMVDYGTGNIGRDPHECPALWSLQRGSNCTLAQAEHLAANFAPIHGSYNLLTNNCHHFAEWLIQKLINGDCELQ